MVQWSWYNYIGVTMGNPLPAILEVENLIDILYLDPASNKVDAKVEYLPSSGMCLVRLLHDDNEESLLFELDIVVFAKAKTLGYLKETQKSHEYRLTSHPGLLARARAVRDEWLKRKKDFAKRLAERTAQAEQRNQR